MSMSVQSMNREETWDGAINAVLLLLFLAGGAAVLLGWFLYTADYRLSWQQAAEKENKKKKSRRKRSRAKKDQTEKS